MKPILGAAFLVLALAGTARADSDGYFCVGNDYIAYQFGLAAPPVGPHRLTIVRFGARGFYAPQVVDLPQFQVHGMSCGDDVVRVAGFDRIYAIALGAPPRVIESTVIPEAERGHFDSASFVQRSLASLSHATANLETDRIPLAKAANGHVFELVITPTKSAKPCTVQLVSQLVELGDAGHPLATRDVFRGEGHKECGE